MTRRLIKGAFYLLCMLLAASCSNLTTYDSPNRMVSAHAGKHLFLPGKKRRLTAIFFKDPGGGLHSNYPAIFVAREYDGVELVFNLLNPRDRNLPNLRKVASDDPSYYVPLQFPKAVDVYEGDGIHLIASKADGKLLRLMVSGEGWKIGARKDEMKELPILIGDLRLLFGRGTYTNILTL